MSYNAHKRKVSKETQRKILELYKTDRNAARDLCEALGLSRGYATATAHHYGIKSKTPYLRNGVAVFTDTHDDPRWAWAIERGPVVV